MAKKQEIWIHIVFWILFIGMGQVQEIFIEGRRTAFFWLIMLITSFTIAQLTVFYLNYLYICKAATNNRWFLFFFAQVLLLFIFPTIRYFLEEVVIYRITGKHNYGDTNNLIKYWNANTYYAIWVILLSITLYFVKQSWNATRKMNELQLEKKNAELQMLKNQLSPHFLFNTLNSFYADLIVSEPKIAEGILKLSDMLRYITYNNEKDWVFVKDEMQFIQNYIDLYNRRFERSFRLDATIAGDMALKKIPSLLLIHFVENAFKHGILDEEDNPVKIVAKTEADRLDFLVKNYYRKNERYDEPGIGYKNIRKRLDILFPKNYTLEVEDLNCTYEVRLNIPLSA